MIRPGRLESGSHITSSLRDPTIPTLQIDRYLLIDLWVIPSARFKFVLHFILFIDNTAREGFEKLGVLWEKEC